jgi:hypothetical protein
MRLFELAASGDIEGFVDDLRAQLEDAGVEFEDMNFIQQKALARTLGVDPVIMQRLMNDNITAVESIADATTQAAGEMSKETRDSLIMGMGRMPTPDMDELYKMRAEFENIGLEQARTMDRAYEVTQNNILTSFDLLVGKTTAAGELVQRNVKIIRDAADDMLKAQKSFKAAYETPVPSGPVTPTVIPVSPAAVTPSLTAATPTAAVGAATPATPATPAASPAQEVLLNLKITAAEGVEKALSWFNFEWANGDLFTTSPENIRVRVQTASQ